MKYLLLAFALLTSGLAHAKEGMLAGNLTSVGSDTLGNLMALWGEHFTRQYPGVNVQIQAAGSSTAPTALAAGAAQLGAMSRPMQAVERQLFEDRFGYPPLAIPVAMDALVVMVNQDNPVQQIDMAQLDAIFSVTRRCGAAKAVTHWGDVLPASSAASWATRSLQRFGRNSASGTWGFFKQQALCNGDFRNDVGEYPGSSAVVQAVANTAEGIGYASMGIRFSGVRTLAISRDGGESIAPTTDNIRSGRYPWSRPLFVYINKQPGKPVEPLTAAFLRAALSREGQALVTQAGYLPLSDKQIQQAQAMLNAPAL